jgi:hypothetical protein
MATSAVAVLVLTGCAGGDESVTTEAAAPSTSSATTAATPAGGAMAVNEEVRTACQEAVTEKLAGAEFATRGNLRAASTDGGKIFTVAGTAQGGGADHPYTCEITVIDGETTVGAVTVDGK